MKQVQRAIGMSVIAAAAFWAVAGVQWAANIFVFVTGHELALALIVACSRDGNALMVATYQKGEHLPGWVDFFYYAVLVLGLVGAGCWFHGIAWLVIGMLDAGHRARAKESVSAVEVPSGPRA